MEYPFRKADATYPFQEIDDMAHQLPELPYALNNVVNWAAINRRILQKRALYEPMVSVS
jgi:hypothetical protein